MRAKRRCMHGRKIRKPGAPKKYDFSKKVDYSSEATKGTIGDKIANAVTPKNWLDLIPVSKGVKAAKGVYNYLRS